ncbi:MAG: zinc-dependent metalloprotease [bacterium]
MNTKTRLNPKRDPVRAGKESDATMPITQGQNLRGLPGLLLVALFVAAASAPVASGEENYFPKGPKKSSQETSKEAPPAKGQKPFKEVTKDHEVKKGLFTLYQSKDHLYFEVVPEQLNKDYIFMSFIDRGLGSYGVIEGLPLDDFLLTVRQVNDKLEFVKRNVYFKSDADKAQTKAVQRAFTESLLAALPIEATNPDTKGMLVDLKRVLIADMPAFAFALQEIIGNDLSPDEPNSRFTDVRVFPENIELTTLNHYQARRPAYAEGIPDARSVNLGFHYSIAKLPEDSTYRPRVADDRVGYFLVAIKDFSKDMPNPFHRYIIRWNLEKKDPTAPLSEPKQPIVFWVENTTPPEYRQAVKEGIESWNKAFEAAGFKDAIVGKIMPDDADWDPADMQYSVIRWITSNQPAFGGIGPAIVNPLTGEILNADVLVEGETIRGLRRGYRIYTRTRDKLAWIEHPEEQSIAPPRSLANILNRTNPLSGFFCSYGMDSLEDAFLGEAAMLASGEMTDPYEVPDWYIQDYIRSLVAHEIGHVIGLRHNFKGTTHIALEDLNNTDLTERIGLSASVMDYAGTNIAPPGTKQGEYFQRSVGTYDVWAIQYGYTPVDDAKTPEDEVPALTKIAERTEDPLLPYGTDEDTWHWSAIPVAPDPTSNANDLSSDPLAFYQQRIQLAEYLFGKIGTKFTQPGENYVDLRLAVDGLFATYGARAIGSIKWVGGTYIRRYHEGDPGGKAPVEVVSPADQRRALALLEEYVFPDKHFNFDVSLLQKLTPSRWAHWGMGDVFSDPRLDYPLYDRVTGMRAGILTILFSQPLLQRIVDNQLRSSAGAEAFTLSELFSRVTNAIFTEVNSGPAKGAAYSDTSPFISTYRRATQRDFVRLLVRLALTNTGAPEDTRSLAWMHLRSLYDRINKLAFSSGDKLDVYSRAHLDDLAATIGRALDAKYTAPMR